MKIYTNYLNSKWARLGLLTMALSSTLSITPSQSLMEQKIFASSEGTHQAPNTDTKEAAAKISGQLKALNGNDSFSNEVVEVIRMEIPTDNGKLKVTLEKSEKTGQILAIIPWNQTEGSVCIDNTCSDRKSFQIETRFSDFKGNESDIQVQILKEIKKAKAKSSEAKEEKQKEEVKIDSSIRENILPPKKTDLTEGGKLLAQAVKSCDEDVKCLHTEFLDILKGDKRPSVAEALNFYTNYLEEKIINLLTKETKESLFSLYFGTRDKGLKIIRDLLAKIPSGFLPLREAIVYTQEKSIKTAAATYVDKYSSGDFNSVVNYYSTLQNLRTNGQYNVNSGLFDAHRKGYINPTLMNSLQDHYAKYSTNLWGSFDQYFANPRQNQSWIDQLVKPLPELDLTKYQIPVDYKSIQLLPTSTSIQMPVTTISAPPASVQSAPAAVLRTGGRIFGRGL